MATSIPRMSDYPHGWRNNFSVRNIPIVMSNIGNTFWVDSGLGSDSGSGDRDHPFATIDYAIGRCTASNGDRIMVAAGHAETLTAAGAITCDVAGVAIIGIGEGGNRPTLTFGTSTSASVVISAANVTIANIVGVANIDGLTNPFHVQASNCTLDIQWQDGSSTIEAARAILTTASANKLIIKLKYLGFTAGDACVNAIRLVGGTSSRIIIDFYGKASTSVVEFLTTATVDALIEGYMYVSGTTNGSKDVVDTVTGSTWFANIYDGAAGALYSGGSASAFSADDISSITDALYGTNGITTFPAASAAANAVSLAEVIRYISEYQIPRITSKAIASAAATLTTGASPVTLFTVTGDVLCRVWAVISTAITSTSSTGTLEVGVTGNTAGLLPQTTANGTNFPSNSVWAGDNSPTLNGEVLSSAGLNWFLIGTGADIICTVATNSMTAGVLTFYCQYIPLNSSSTLVAA